MLARRLFARVLDAPGGINILTIHAFCQALLKRFPLEASVTPGFEVADEAKAAGLLDRVPRVLPIATSEYPTPARRPAFSVLDNAKLARIFDLHMRPWREGLKEVIGQVASARSSGEIS